MAGFIGDEPKSHGKHRDGAGYHQPKIPSEMINVLLKWASYSPLDRAIFKKAALGMLKKTGTTWLLKNEQHEVNDRQEAAGVKKVLVLNTPFTPAPVRRSFPQGSDHRGSPIQRATPGSSVAQELRYTPAHAPHARAYGQAHALAQGQADALAQGYGQNSAHGQATFPNSAMLPTGPLPAIRRCSQPHGIHGLYRTWMPCRTPQLDASTNTAFSSNS